MMADHPTLFSAPMVRAILREIERPGTGKTQTRRTSGVPEIEQQPNGLWHIHNRHGGVLNVAETDIGSTAADMLLIEAGDRLWLREAWRLPATLDADSPAQFAAGIREMGCTGPNGLVCFEADGRDAWGDVYGTLPVGRLRASMHLPRALSRLTLYVTDVRVQRLQDISDEDALAEGAYLAKRSGRISDDYATMAVAGHWFSSSRHWYADLWDRINGPGAWEANPWVVAYTFVPARGNIDTLPSALKEVA